jgi:hypothetical protein
MLPVRSRRWRPLLERRAPWLFVWGGMLSVPGALAGNLDSFYVSSDAALAAGAIVATSRTGGSIWYNPAGMSRISGTRLDVNVSGYALRLGAQVGFDSTLPNVHERQLTLFELDVVPAAVTITRRFGNVGIGLGAFVPAQTSVNLRTHLAASDGQGRTLEFGYDSRGQVRQYHAGPGVGWWVTPDWNLGLSLLANYRTRAEATDVSATVEEDFEGEKRQFGWMQHNRLDSVGVGLELVLGTQWEIGRGYSFGFVVRTPSLRLGDAAEQIDSELVSNSEGAGDQTITFNEKIAFGTQLLSPFRFHAGLSRRLGNFTTSVEGSVLLPFKNDPLGLHNQATINARLGVTCELDSRWSVGGGVYTDRSPAPLPEQFLDKKIDYYGATLALNWKNFYGIFSRGREQLEEPRALEFGTTLALSYALGLGTIAGAVVGPAPGGGIEVAAKPAQVTAHEFVLHVATAIAE